METYNVPHDFDNRSLGHVALQLLVDELFANSDKELFRIFNNMMETNKDE